jgi:hypothetical protein
MLIEKYLKELIDSLSFKVKYVEVGVLRGDCIVYIAKNSQNIEKCTGVDPYEKYGDNNYIVGEKTSKLNYSICKNKINDNNLNDKISILLLPSHLAKDEFENDSLGVVYLDKIFNENDVNQDISDWWPKIKKGGYLTGRYTTNIQINKALLDKVKQLNLLDCITIENDVWKIIKK